MSIRLAVVTIDGKRTAAVFGRYERVGAGKLALSSLGRGGRRAVLVNQHWLGGLSILGAAGIRKRDVESDADLIDSISRACR